MKFFITFLISIFINGINAFPACVYDCENSICGSPLISMCANNNGVITGSVACCADGTTPTCSFPISEATCSCSTSQTCLTVSPTNFPTNFPTNLPTNFPTKLPTRSPISPTPFPSYIPTTRYPTPPYPTPPPITEGIYFIPITGGLSFILFMCLCCVFCQWLKPNPKNIPIYNLNPNYNPNHPNQILNKNQKYIINNPKS